MDPSDTVVAEPVEDIDTAAIAAMREGVASVEEPAVESAADTAVVVADDPAAVVDEVVVPDPKVAVEDEIKSLGLKEKTADRFRDLVEAKNAYEPLKAMLDKAGVKDMAELPRMLDRVRDSDDMIKMVQETGATPEQFGTTLDYLRTVNAANRGDTVAANRLYEMLQGEMASVAKMIGKPVAGIYDPLSEHADLKALVESGELDQKHAEELAGARSAAKFATDRQTATAQQTQQQAQLQQAETQAEQAIIALDTQWKAADPQYAQRRPFLNAQVHMIRQTLPPAQWEQATKMAYQNLLAIPMAQAPAASVRAGAVPIRPTGSRPNIVQDVSDMEPIEAMRTAWS